jgi:hypothetical protein
VVHQAQQAGSRSRAQHSLDEHPRRCEQRLAEWAALREALLNGGEITATAK